MVMPQSLISPLSIENEVGSYQLIYKFKNRNLWIYSRLIIKHSVIPVEKYDQLKKLIDASFQVEREIIYLNKAE